MILRQGGAPRFLAEIVTTANLQHPNIVPLFDSGSADGFLYYAMPFIDGESLRDRLERERRLPVDDVIRIAGDVSEALQVAHERGVIHRDIKPANILLSRGPRARGRLRRTMASVRPYRTTRTFAR